jgi:hypothetical protein
MLEGVSARSMRSEVRMDERSGGAGKLEEEEVLAWTGVATEEGATARGEEGAVVEEEGTVVEAVEIVWVFVGLSILELGRGEVIAGFRFLFGNGGGTPTAIDVVGSRRCDTRGDNLLCS